MNEAMKAALAHLKEAERLSDVAEVQQLIDETVPKPFDQKPIKQPASPYFRHSAWRKRKRAVKQQKRSRARNRQ